MNNSDIGFLVLERNPGESIIIGNNKVITVMNVRQGFVTFSVETKRIIPRSANDREKITASTKLRIDDATNAE